MNKPNSVKVKVNEHDKRDTQQLKAARFSGIRDNELANQFEIWVLGRMEKTVTYSQFQLNEHSLTTAYCEVFGLREATIAGAVADAMKEMRDRKEATDRLRKKNPRLVGEEEDRLSKLH